MGKGNKKVLVTLTFLGSSTAGARGGTLICIRNYLDILREQRERDFRDATTIDPTPLPTSAGHDLRRSLLI